MKAASLIRFKKPVNKDINQYIYEKIAGYLSQCFSNIKKDMKRRFSKYVG
jgi:hypothetical protein